MNRFFGLIFLIMILNFSDSYGQGIILGAKGGANMSSLNVDNAKYKVGYQIGGFAKLMVTRLVGIETEAVYSSQHSVIGSENIELNYLSVPVLLNFNLNEFIDIHIGPQYSMLVDSNGQEESLESTVKSKNICLAVGIGVNIPMGFSASLRFVNDLNNNNNIDVSSDMVQLSMSIALLQLEN